MSCKEAEISSKSGKNDQLFEDLSKVKGFKRCPKCKVMVHLYDVSAIYKLGLRLYGVQVRTHLLLHVSSNS